VLLLKEKGIEAYALLGGYRAWMEAKLPMTTGPQP
jgi:rhodanese-related sulfurtransferase